MGDADADADAGPANRDRWALALRAVAETHRNAAQAARFAGDEEASARHLRVAERAEQVVADLRFLPVTTRPPDDHDAG